MAPSAHSPLIPKSPAIAGWLSGIGERLGYRVFLIALLVLRGRLRACCFCCAPARVWGASPARWAIALVAVLHAGGVRRSDSALHRRLQLHRLRAHGRRARAQPLPARAALDRQRSGLQYVGHRLDARRHGLRPALHAALLPACAARREGRGVGDEADGAARLARARSCSRGAARACAASTRCWRCWRSVRTRCM